MQRVENLIAGAEAAGRELKRALRPCYSIGVSEFTRWLAKAKPLSEIVYAHGHRLDGKRDVCKAAREAQARREVHLFVRRQPSGTFHFIARRTAVENLGSQVGTRSDRPCATAPARSKVLAEGEAGRVLTLLTDTAAAALACPSNRQIAVALRIHDARRVRYLIDQLERDGRIAVERRGQRITRVVTITATGRRTSDARTPVGLGFEKIGTERQGQ